MQLSGILCKSKHLPRAHCDQQRDHTRKQNDRGFIPSGRLEENAVQGVAQRLGAHGDSQDIICTAKMVENTMIKKHQTVSTR